MQRPCVLSGSAEALIACGRCSCSVVGEIKKQKYIYYHCTGYADKCRGEPAFCRRKYVREEVLEKQFTAMLGQLRFDDEVLEWVRQALHESRTDERREHDEDIKRLQAEHKRLGEPCSEVKFAAGGFNEGQPGFRDSYGPHFYVCYPRDPQGNKTALFYNDPDEPGREG
jgi:hypothetical protein